MKTRKWMPGKKWSTQGQTRNVRHSKRDVKLLRYLVGISLDRGIDPEKLFSKIVYAWKNGASKYGQLTIECRENVGDHAFFLITANREVIVQFSASEHLLVQTAPLKQFAYEIECEKKFALMKRRIAEAAKCRRIRDLRAGMKRVNLKARVLKISNPRRGLAKHSGYVPFTKATLTDGTGTIGLTLWNNRINSLLINDAVEIRNAQVITYRGETQLQIGKQGRLRVIETSTYRNSLC